MNQDAGDNTTVKIGFPKGIYMEELPGFCTGAGSALTPEKLPTPQLPLSANSLDFHARAEPRLQSREQACGQL